MKVDLHRFDNTEIVIHNLERYEQTVHIKLFEVLKQRGLTLSDLHRLTGIRNASLSELANGRKFSLNIVHIVVIMQALRITDIRELFDVEFSPETVEKWNEEMKHHDSGLTSKQLEETNENLKMINK
ncbi:helix-turn-helix domain-containing protein [Alkalicoccobacillus gibsonii]|uniref:helix-turn-helix domain-containing protein n=1 Tax=Alkalicoccobacillus gibsonii TaxID=79881 RepID=UPI003511C279